MAPLKSAKQDGSTNDVTAILDLAKSTVAALQNREELSDKVQDEISRYIKRAFPLPIASALAGKLSEIDALGCSLWNAATNILRDEQLRGEEDAGVRGSHGHVLQLLRTLAFLLLNTAHRATSRRSKDEEQQIRNFRIGLKAARSCLDADEQELGLKLLEACAEHITPDSASPLVRIANVTAEVQDNKRKLGILASKYYLLRMTHAWKCDRLDLADHFFNKFTLSASDHMAAVGEMSAQMCFVAGQSLSHQRSYETSTKWMQRALSALDVGEVEELGMDANELRLSIVSSLVDDLLSIGSPDSLTNAKQLVEQLDSAWGLGNRVAVQVLRLKVILTMQPADLTNVEDAVQRLLRTAILTEKTLRLAMKTIHRTQKVSTDTACNALEQLVVTRLLPDFDADNPETGTTQEWIEKACVSHTLFATTGRTRSIRDTVERLERVFNAVRQRVGKSLSPKATHAMQTLIWKATSAEDGECAELWCGLLRHAIFESVGHVNKAKVGRKLMSAAIAKGDLEAARTIYFEMPIVAQNESITRYLAFRLALRENDYEFALECLQMLLKHADRDATFLYACVLEAQQSEMRHIAVAALQAILDKRSPGVHLPSLLRCTARLLIGELDPPMRSLEEVVQEVVRIFETAASSLRELKQGSSEEQWRSEIQWWSKNAYNIALKQCGLIDPEFLVRLLQAGCRFIDAYPHDDGVIHNHELHKRKCISHFLTTATLIVLGRSHEEGSEYSLQCYAQARQRAAAYRKLQQNAARPAKEEESQRRTDEQRLFELQKFELECILNLQQWEEVSATLQACLELVSVDKWDTLADIVLIIHQQVGPSGLSEEANSRMMALLDRIINDTWAKHKDIVKASRWLRLAFSLDLTDGDATFALKLITQAAQMAKRQQDKGLELFPETELQWLAITAFNKAVDLLSAGQQEECLQWVEAALGLARHAIDNGALHANLTERKERVVVRMKEAM